MAKDVQISLFQISTQDTAFFCDSLILKIQGEKYNRTYAAEKLGEILDKHPKTILMIARGGYAGVILQKRIYDLYKKMVVKKKRKPPPKRISVTFPDDSDLVDELKKIVPMEERRKLLIKAAKKKKRKWF